VYVMTWWLVFFMALPIGVKPPHEVGSEAEAGHEAGAPVRPLLLKKVLAATIISGLITALIHWVIVSDVISFRNA
jgi:predicted secreted protein